MDNNLPIEIACDIRLVPVAGLRGRHVDLAGDWQRDMT
jgi:hypothetical protein